MSKALSIAEAMQAAVGKSDTAQEVEAWIDTGYPPLNDALSGNPEHGIPQGRIIEIFGPSSSGKTLLSTLLSVAAQKQGGFAGFCDHEKTFQVSFAARNGLSEDPNQWAYFRPKTWEESNTIAMKAAEAIRDSKLIKKDAPIVWTFDSVAAMIPKSVFEKGIDEHNMNDTTALARVSSATLKVINYYTSLHNATIIYLNQTRTKPGVVYGDPTTTPGGASFEFYSTVRLSLAKRYIKEKIDGVNEATGQYIGITVKKNKIARPLEEIAIRLNYLPDGMTQFDFTLSMIELIKDKGMFQAGKAGFIIWPQDGKQYTPKQLRDHINEHNLLDQLTTILYGRPIPMKSATAS